MTAAQVIEQTPITRSGTPWAVRKFGAGAGAHGGAKATAGAYRSEMIAVRGTTIATGSAAACSTLYSTYGAGRGAMPYAGWPTGAASRWRVLLCC